MFIGEVIYSQPQDIMAFGRMFFNLSDVQNCAARLCGFQSYNEHIRFIIDTQIRRLLLDQEDNSQPEPATEYEGYNPDAIMRQVGEASQACSHSGKTAEILRQFQLQKAQDVIAEQISAERGLVEEGERHSNQLDRVLLHGKAPEPIAAQSAPQRAAAAQRDAGAPPEQAAGGTHGRVRERPHGGAAAESAGGAPADRQERRAGHGEHLQQAASVLSKLAEFGRQGVEIQRVQDLGFSVLFQPTFQELACDYQRFAVYQVVRGYLNRSLRVSCGGGYLAGLRHKQLFRPNVLGVSNREYVHGIKNILGELPGTVLVCTNIACCGAPDVRTQLQHFESTGKAVQYLTGRQNATPYANVYRFLPVVFRGNYARKPLSTMCVVFTSFVGPKQAENEVFQAKNATELCAEAERCKILQRGQFEVVAKAQKIADGYKRRVRDAIAQHTEQGAGKPGHEVEKVEALARQLADEAVAELAAFAAKHGIQIPQSQLPDYPPLAALRFNGYFCPTAAPPAGGDVPPQFAGAYNMLDGRLCGVFGEHNIMQHVREMMAELGVAVEPENIFFCNLSEQGLVNYRNGDPQWQSIMTVNPRSQCYRNAFMYFDIKRICCLCEQASSRGVQGDYISGLTDQYIQQHYFDGIEVTPRRQEQQVYFNILSFKNLCFQTNSGGLHDGCLQDISFGQQQIQSQHYINPVIQFLVQLQNSQNGIKPQPIDVSLLGISYFAHFQNSVILRDKRHMIHVQQYLLDTLLDRLLYTLAGRKDAELANPCLLLSAHSLLNDSLFEAKRDVFYGQKPDSFTSMVFVGSINQYTFAAHFPGWFGDGARLYAVSTNTAYVASVLRQYGQDRSGRQLVRFQQPHEPLCGGYGLVGGELFRLAAYGQKVRAGLRLPPDPLSVEKADVEHNYRLLADVETATRLAVGCAADGVAHRAVTLIVDAFMIQTDFWGALEKRHGLRPAQYRDLGLRLGDLGGVGRAERLAELHFGWDSFSDGV